MAKKKEICDKQEKKYLKIYKQQQARLQQLLEPTILKHSAVWNEYKKFKEQKDNLDELIKNGELIMKIQLQQLENFQENFRNLQ